MRRSLVLAILLAGCHGHPMLATLTPAGQWSYDVAEEQDGRVLAVTADFPPGTPGAMRVDGDTRRFVQRVEWQDGGGWSAAATTAGGWTVPGCAEHGCRVRYRFALGDAARTLDDLDRAARLDDAYLVAPSAWMLGPRAATGRSFRLRVRHGDAMTAGLTASGPDVREGPLPFPSAPVTIFGRFRPLAVNVQNARIDVAVTAPSLAVTDAQVRDWVRSDASAIAAEYGRYPVDHLLLTLPSARWREIGYGQTMGGGGAAITVFIGPGATGRELGDDWVLEHEMVHLALPSLEARYHWLEEGIATYLEPFARTRAGLLDDERVWSGLVHGLPLGEPEPGDEGIDRTPTWGRTYWGGALFCFVADLTIREKSGGKRSLDDALRAIVRAGGSIETSWDLERVLQTGDRGTGLTVLHDLHAAWSQTPVEVDLAGWWKRLGVVVRDGRFAGVDDGAPLAHMRKAMVARR